MSAHKPPGHDQSSDGFLSKGHLNDGHLSNDALIEALYGLSGADAEEHMRACTACATRRNDLEEKRAATAPVNATAAAMAELRKNIYRRIEHPSLAERVLSNATSRWAAPALAGVAACVLAIGVLAHSPLRPADSAVPAASSVAQSAPAMAGDTQLYTDVYAMEQSFEPSASASLGVLFEEPEGVAKPGAGRVAEQQ
jgi:hypothetical protein